MANTDGTVIDAVLYESLDDVNGTAFDGYDYVSLVSGETYGPPALVAPARGSDTGPRAEVGDKVLYINTRFVPAFELTRRRP
jgi:hypothetical protein